MQLPKTLQLVAYLFFSGIVVNIATASNAFPAGLVVIQTEFERPEAAPIQQSCLGFVVESDGYLLTSYKQIIDPDTGRYLARYMRSYKMVTSKLACARK